MAHAPQRRTPDTAAWQAQNQGTRCAFFLDVDLPSITHYKASVIEQSPVMRGVLETCCQASAGSAVASISVGTDQSGGLVESSDYALLSCDLCDKQAVQKLLKHPGLNPQYGHA